MVKLFQETMLIIGHQDGVIPYADVTFFEATWKVWIMGDTYGNYLIEKFNTRMNLYGVANGDCL